MSGKHILAFEPDPVYAQMLKDDLGARGLDVEVVSDGAEGLERAATATHDLIYLCIELPRISGFSVCNKLRKNANTKGIPLVITSAEANQETFDKHKKLKVRADEYLLKPFDAAALFAVVGGLLGLEEDELVVEDDDELVIEDDDDEGKNKGNFGLG